MLSHTGAGLSMLSLLSNCHRQRKYTCSMNSQPLLHSLSSELHTVPVYLPPVLSYHSFTHRLAHPQFPWSLCFITQSSPVAGKACISDLNMGGGAGDQSSECLHPTNRRIGRCCDFVRSLHKSPESYELDRILGYGEVVGNHKTLFDHADKLFDLSFPSVCGVLPSFPYAKASILHDCDNQDGTLLIDKAISLYTKKCCASTLLGTNILAIYWNPLGTLYSSVSTNAATLMASTALSTSSTRS
ncbi:hypothetical protein DEU56DRAFT_570648 [Suillus clintonianus]|uniref:uncharacterized protein n=1 Tax=Suillus clintonianus TaxID=1904413 RepID=UPI001B873F5A|nr:uncharacterized protein DEU56DRAFT_570648 [Suillus clintonianus]KAG2125438.1 hypothetical protein DEU56DRAFT_570648 [Suillus clintonianus]